MRRCCDDILQTKSHFVPYTRGCRPSSKDRAFRRSGSRTLTFLVPHSPFCYLRPNNHYQSTTNTLSSHYQSTTNTLSSHYQSTTNTFSLSVHYQHIVTISPLPTHCHYQSTTNTLSLSVHYQHIVTISPLPMSLRGNFSKDHNYEIET